MTPLSIYNQLKDVSDLTPSPKINDLFNQLVSCALSQDKSYDLDHSSQEELWNICSKGEYVLERFWAQRIISSKTPLSTLEEFPYYQNYLRLSNLEWNSLKGCSHHDDHSVLFIGGGPLPLTAMTLADHHGQKVTILECDHEAVTVSRMVLESCGLANAVSVIHISAEHYQNYQDFNTIYVAALAGFSDVEKKNILEKIKNEAQTDTHIVARTAWGNRKLLYKPLSDDIFSIIKPEIRVDTYNDIVNSFIIFKT